MVKYWSNNVIMYIESFDSVIYHIWGPENLSVAIDNFELLSMI